MNDEAARAPARSDSKLPNGINHQQITIEPYGNRFWAVYDAEELVCVCAYKKGAEEVKRRLNPAEAKGVDDAHNGTSQFQGTQEVFNPCTPTESNNQVEKEGPFL